MSSTKIIKITSFLRYSLAHHPVCEQYQEHLLRVKGWSLCLGCLGFYSGFLLGSVLIFLKVLVEVEWVGLIILASLLCLPTILRVEDVRGFDSMNRSVRMSFRGLLGGGIVVGLYSIVNAPSFELQLIQGLIGVGLYATFAYTQNKKGIKERNRLCSTCSFTRNPNCPGMKLIVTWRE